MPSNAFVSLLFLFPLLLFLPALVPATPPGLPGTRRQPRRQTVTDIAAASGCGVEGPDSIAFDKSQGPAEFVLRKTGSCSVGLVDIYPIVSYSSREYPLFSYRTLEDQASVVVTIHLSWPQPSASASDRNQYLVYKAYELPEDKGSTRQPILTKFVKISVVEAEVDESVENYRDPLASYLAIPPSPVYFLDEESAMANATCVTDDFRFSVKAAAKIGGVHPELNLEISVIQQLENGKWELERAWSDGGDSRRDWRDIRDAVGTTIRTTRNGDDEIDVEVDDPVKDAYFVFNVLVKDELNWYRTGTSYFIAKWIRNVCDENQASDIDKVWSEIDNNNSGKTTIRPNVIVDITDKTDTTDKEEEDNKQKDDGVDDKNDAINDNGINKEELYEEEDGNSATRNLMSLSACLLFFVSTLVHCIVRLE